MGKLLQGICCFLNKHWPWTLFPFFDVQEVHLEYSRSRCSGVTVLLRGICCLFEVLGGILLGSQFRHLSGCSFLPFCAGGFQLVLKVNFFLFLSKNFFFHKCELFQRAQNFDAQESDTLFSANSFLFHVVAKS